MKQRRMISSAIWEDENFGKLSPQAKLLFIGLITHADDYGYVKANLPYLRSAVFVYDDISLNKVSEHLREVVANCPSVHLYVVDDNAYLHFSKWTEYQTMRGDRMSASKIPQCLTNGCQNVAKMTPKSLPNIKEDKLKEVKVSIPQQKSRCPLETQDTPLKAQYPNGHKECIEFIDSVVEIKGHKFSNYPKQIGCLHKMLKANRSFSEISRVANKISKDEFYVDKGWDLATVAAQLDRN